MSILEAASCGLYVVSTNSGGIPEVLPDHMRTLTPVQPDPMIQAVVDAIDKVNEIDPWEQHKQVKQMYSWDDVTRRTLKVYDYVDSHSESRSLYEKLIRLQRSGPIAGILVALLLVIDFLIITALEVIWPASQEDLAVPYVLPGKGGKQTQK